MVILSFCLRTEGYSAYPHHFGQINIHSSLVRLLTWFNQTTVQRAVWTLWVVSLYRASDGCPRLKDHNSLAVTGWSGRESLSYLLQCPQSAGITQNWSLHPRALESHFPLSVSECCFLFIHNQGWHFRAHNPGLQISHGLHVISGLP